MLARCGERSSAENEEDLSTVTRHESWWQTRLRGAIYKAFESARWDWTGPTIQRRVENYILFGWHRVRIRKRFNLIVGWDGEGAPKKKLARDSQIGFYAGIRFEYYTKHTHIQAMGIFTQYLSGIVNITQPSTYDADMQLFFRPAPNQIETLYRFA